MKTPMITEAMPATRLTWAPYRIAAVLVAALAGPCP